MLPPHDGLEVQADGTISVLANGQPETLQTVDRLKLVKPPFSQLTKNEAGLLVTRDGSTPAADPAVQVAKGSSNSSNVSAVEEMVATMNLARDFEPADAPLQGRRRHRRTGNRLVRE